MIKFNIVKKYVFVVMGVCMNILFSSAKEVLDNPYKVNNHTTVDMSTYKARKQWLIDSFKGMPISQSGKHGAPFALIRLTAQPTDAYALNYLSNLLNVEGTDDDFMFVPLGLALYRYKANFSATQLANIQSNVERYSRDSLGFYDHNTENHALMFWVGGYLFAQAFPDAHWVNGYTSAQIMTDMKERLRQTFKNVYKHGYAEYLSTTYETAQNVPVEALLECAQDSEVKQMAEAFLLFKWTLISLNNFEGSTLAPYARMNTQQDHAPTYYYVAGSCYTNWLYYGWGPATNNVTTTQFTNSGSDATHSLLTAISKTVPDSVFFQLAALQEPLSILSSFPTYSHFCDGVPNAVLRKGYRTKNYAVGTGNVRWPIAVGETYAEEKINCFSINWSSAHRFNYIGCYSPFFYPAGTNAYLTGSLSDTWDLGNISPFQQTAQYKNTVITLFNIPNTDPWPGKPTGWWSWRSANANNLLKRAQLRYPNTMDQEIEQSGWVFLREGDTYIGIKPLNTYYIERNLGTANASLVGFNVIKSDFAKTGFVIEVGSKDEAGSFDLFRQKLLSNTLTTDMVNLNVSYTNSSNDKLEIAYLGGFPKQYLSSTPVNWTGNYLESAIPTVKINGVQDTYYTQWPLLNSPYATISNSVLDVNYKGTSIHVDWTGNLPVILKK